MGMLLSSGIVQGEVAQGIDKGAARTRDGLLQGSTTPAVWPVWDTAVHGMHPPLLQQSHGLLNSGGQHAWPAACAALHLTPSSSAAGSARPPFTRDWTCAALTRRCSSQPSLSPTCQGRSCSSTWTRSAPCLICWTSRMCCQMKCSAGTSLLLSEQSQPWCIYLLFVPGRQRRQRAKRASHTTLTFDSVFAVLLSWPFCRGPVGCLRQCMA